MMTGQIRIAGTVKESIVDGPGIRFVVFTQGCSHGCQGCHNPDTHDYSRGRLADIERLVLEIRANPLLDGLTLSGGEPFDQAGACAELAREVHKMGKKVWAFSGYTYENLIENEKQCELLYYLDVLVDGKFILAEKTMDKKWCGSSNQRVINVPASIEAGKVILL